MDGVGKRGSRRVRVWVVAGLAFLVALAVAVPAQASGGLFDRTWGKDVASGGAGGFEICTLAASCQTGLTGALAGEFSTPGGVATDTAGNVYVADTLNNRIQEFDSSGNFLRAWGKDVDTAVGTEFEICTVAANCTAGTSGGLGGELYNPVGVATDAAGNVYVADTGNNRIQKFDSSGNFLRTWGKNVDGVGGSGFAEICTTAANCLAGSAATAQGGEFNHPEGVATGTAGNVWVADTNNNRIQKFDSAESFQGAWGRHVSIFDTEACGPSAAFCQAAIASWMAGEFNHPKGVATDTAGNVYVSDTNNHRIDRLDSSGNFLRAWGRGVNGDGGFEICTLAGGCFPGVPGDFGGELYSPAAVATDAAGNVYVADASNGRVQRYDSSGNFARAWGKGVNGGAAFEICTVAASCTIGVVGGLGGELNEPRGIAADAAGNVYVADFGNERVQKFAEPSNAFSIGKLKGTKLSVTVPGPGTLALKSAPGSKQLLKPSNATATGGGAVKITLKLSKAAKNTLRRKRKLKVKAAVTFTPNLGTAASKNRTLKLKK